jgi:DNA-binding LacI/PurR family transcriptional regulator
LKKALKVLVKERILYQRQGAGTYIGEAAEDTAKAGRNLVLAFIQPVETLHMPLSGYLIEKLQKSGYLALVSDPNGEDFLQEPERMLKDLLAFEPVACVVNGVREFPYKFVIENRKLFGRLIFINSFPANLHLDASFVLSDSWKSWYLPTKHLLDLGHRRIMAITYPAPYPVERERFDSVYQGICGYKDALEEYGILKNYCLLREDVGNFEVWKKRFIDVFNSEERPTAIVANGDWRAIKAIEVLKELKLKVPDDVSIIGMHNTPWSQEASPPLTTIDCNWDTIAALAADKISQPANMYYNERILVEPKLIVRDSCKKIN